MLAPFSKPPAQEKGGERPQAHSKFRDGPKLAVSLGKVAANLVERIDCRLFQPRRSLEAFFARAVLTQEGLDALGSTLRCDFTVVTPLHVSKAASASPAHTPTRPPARVAGRRCM